MGLDAPKKNVSIIFNAECSVFGFDYANEISDLNMLHAIKASSFAVRYHHELRKLKNWACSFCFFLGLLGTLVLCLDRRYFFWNKYPAFLLLILIFFYWCAVHGFFFGFRKNRWAIELFFIYPASFFLWWVSQIYLQTREKTILKPAMMSRKRIKAGISYD